jgi:hypothetical protein
MSKTAPRHGTIFGYRNDGCRCQDCTEAKRIYTRAQRAAYLASDHVNHGTASAWDAGCRCDDCRRDKRDRDVRWNLNRFPALSGDEAPEGFGFCFNCRGMFGLKADGTLRRHGVDCPGVGLLPNGEPPAPKPRKPRGRRPCILIDVDLAAELLRSMTIKDAAEKLGVNRRTLERRISVTPELRAARAERTLDFEHGTPSAYTYHRCRCEVCREGNRLRMRQLMLNRSERTVAAPHGTVSGYTNWKCRCAPCKKAGSENNRRTRARRLARAA